MAGSRAPSVVLYGDEEFFLDRYICKVRFVANREVIVIDGSSVDGPGIVSECRANIMGDRKVVIVDDAQGVKQSSALDSYLKKPSDTTLIAVCRSKSLPKTWEAATEVGKILHYPKLKTWDNNNEILGWIEREAGDLELVLDGDVPTMLFDFYGDDLYGIANTLRKLSWLLGKGGKVTSSVVVSVAIRTRNSTGFRVADAVFVRNIRKALQEFSLLCVASGENSAAILTVSALQKQICKLILARHALDRGSDSGEVAAQLEMHPWRFKTYFQPMVQEYTLKTLLDAMAGLCRLDLDVKGQARGSKRTLVELFLCDLANMT